MKPVALVVDDEPAVRELVSTILQQHGFLTISACGAEEARALSAMPRQRIDVLVAEAQLGDGNGIELATRIQSARPGIAVLMISGGPEYRNQADTSEYAFLAKPFLPQQLLTAVDRVMARRQTAAG